MSEKDFPNLKFLVDAMLQKVGKWLRILGYDTYIAKREEDKELLKILEKEKRILITSDRSFAKEAKEKGYPVYLFLRRGPRSILSFLIKELSLDTRKYFLSRCSICNTLLVKRGDRYFCPFCKKEYWEGSHVRRMGKYLESL